jgi:hypothetical protein
MEQFGGVFTDNVATYSFAPNTSGPLLLVLGESIDATTITVHPLAPGWEADCVIQQSADDGDVAVTWSGVTWFGGTPTIVTGAGAKSLVHLFSPDGTTVYGYGIGTGESSLSVPQSHPTEATQTSADPTAASAVDVATTASALTQYGFTQAQADSIPVNINALITDAASLRLQMLALVDDVASLITWGDGLQAKLIAAGVLS